MADLGIKLQPGTQIYQINVEDLRPTQLCVGMQQVCHHQWPAVWGQHARSSGHVPKR